jgi:hypothetical protein
VTLATLDDRRDGLGDRYLDFPTALRILKGVDRSLCSLYVLGILVLVQDLIRVAFDTDLWILVEIR